MTVTRIPRLFTIKEASDATKGEGAAGISVSTIKRDIRDKKLRSSKLRGAHRILDDDFAEYLRGRKS